jgi:DNA-damage-inducible protein D
MNGDTSKPEIATAQAYFVEQTHRQESQLLLSEEERRAQLRDRVRAANRRLSGAAKDAGVRNKMFGVFHDEGYKGLYAGLGVKAIKARKGIQEKRTISWTVSGLPNWQPMNFALRRRKTSSGPRE